MNKAVDDDLMSIIAQAAEAQGHDVSGFLGPQDSPKCLCCGTTRVAHFGLECPPCKTERAFLERKTAIGRVWREQVPASFQKSKFGSRKLLEQVRDRDAEEAAKRSTFATFVTLVGEAGAGKSSLACAMLLEHLVRGSTRESKRSDAWRARRSRFVVAIDLVAARKEWGLGDGEPPLVDSCRRAGVLVLDDLGAHRDQPHDTIYSIIHERHREERPTIVTTWMDEAAITKNFDGGLARRLFHDSIVIPVRKLPKP